MVSGSQKSNSYPGSSIASRDDKKIASLGGNGSIHVHLRHFIIDV